MALFNFMRKINHPMMTISLHLMRVEQMAVPQSELVIKQKQNLRRLRMLAAVDSF